MANNIDDERMKSLKASFCRQHFPDLLQFLRDFDISSSFNEIGDEIDYKECLNMHFLTQAYEDEKIPQQKYGETDEIFECRKRKTHESFEKTKRILKENCKWSLDSVDESDVLQAVEEYFKIVSSEHDTTELTSILVNNILTESKAYTLFLEDSLETLYQFEDNTTLRILHELNIDGTNNESTLGIQRNTFAKFLLMSTDIGGNPQDKSFSDRICQQRPEIRFIQAFELLASIRNWTNHNYVSLFRDPNNSYCLYRFIIFTHIALIYVCRRVWNNSNAVSCLKKNGFTEPSNITCEDTKLEVNIRANVDSQTISNCEYSLDNGQEWLPIEVGPGNPLNFKLGLKRYQKYILRFICNNESYNTVVKLNYYAWDPILNIKVKPPKSFSYSFKGIAGKDIETEGRINTLLTKFFDNYSNNNIQDENSAEILKSLGTIEPLLKELVNYSDNFEENKDIINKVKATISEKLYTVEQKLDEILEKINKIEKIVDGVKTTTESIKENTDNLIRTTEKIQEDGKNQEKERERKKKRQDLIIKLVSFLLIFGIGFFALWYCIKEPIKANVIWLQHPIFISIISLILIYGAFITPCKTWNPLKAIKEEKKDGEKVKKGTKWISSICFILMILASFVMLPFHSGRSLIDNYNFLGQDSTNNKYVARFLDDYLPYDEELTRTKLALYYTDIVGDLEKAEYYSAPMLDMEKFKTGSLVAMYVLYCRKEIPTLSNLLEKYKDTYGEDDPSYCELQGALLLDTLYGYRDVHKGTELLWKAYDAGSITACYNLGYLYSNDESTMEAIEQGRTIQNSNYDLPLAINFLKIACIEMPKASVLLGDIYSDLGMPDSAFYYYEKAMTETVEGNIFKYASYKHGVLTNIYGFKPNDGLLYSQSMKYAPAMMFSSIAMELDKNLFYQIGKDPYTKYFFLFFKNKDHKQAIKWFESAIKYGKELELKDLGVYQYIPPVVLDHIFIGEKEKALAVLQQYRSGSKFDMSFVNAVELLLGSNLVERDSIKGMQLMHESAANGCLYSKMFCIYRDTEKSLKKNPSAFIDSKQLKEISKEIPFAHVIESLLLMRAGRTKDAEEAAHMALWKRHPAGGFAFEFMPNEYYEDFEEKIINGIDNCSVKDLYLLRKLQEMTLRSTSTMKDRSLLFTCILDKALHDKTKEDFSENFVFWSQTAVDTDSHSSQIRLLRIYQDMIKEGYKDNQNIIDPLIRSVVFNMMRGDYDFAPEYINYILHFLKDRRLVSEGLYRNLLNSYGTEGLFKKLKSIEGAPNRVPATFHTTPLYFIDDFSIFTDFSYLTGMYTLFMKVRGDKPSFVFNMSEEDYFSNWTK